MTSSDLKTSGIWDNHHRGTIGGFLKEKILPGSDLSFVSAYFTIYAYASLKEHLDRINHLRFLFGEPRFIKSLDPDKAENKSFRIEDDTLLLTNRLEQKRVANLLDPDQLEALVAEELTYREKQLIRLRDEVIDLEEMDDNVSLSEFTLDDFRVKLMSFLISNREKLEKAPLGLYAVTPTLDDMKGSTLFDKNWHEIVRPGVIFCLRHKNPPKGKRSSRVNPLGRYYLLYIRDDGTVRFSFTQAKNCLSMFQKLCVGKSAPYQVLCELFDQQTENGAKMDKYSDLLVRAVKAIVRSFQKRTAAGLQSGRDFVIPDKKEQATDTSDFELITWLVIKSGETGV